MSRKKEVEKIINRVIKKEAEGLNNKEILNAYKKNRRHRSRITKEDIKLFNKFVENAKQGQALNDHYFRLKYIHDLNIDWLYFICLGKKNIGKTYEYMRLINKEIAEGNQVVLVRSQMTEITRALVDQFNDQEDCNVKIQSRSYGKYDLVHKWKTDDKGKPIKVGICAAVSSLTSYQGGSYSKVSTIIWDECISDGVQVKLSKDSIKTFERFVSSIKRNKETLKVYIFGNLLAKGEGILQGDPLLEYFGIPYDCNLKYITDTDTKTYKGAKLLFLNTKNMFKGIEDQGVIAGIDVAANERLAKNIMPEPSEKVAGEDVFLDAKPLFSLFFTYNTHMFTLTVAKAEGETQSRPIMRLNVFYPDLLPTCSMYTNESALYNAHKSCCKFVQEETWTHYIRRVVRMFQSGRVLIADKISDADLKTRIIKHFEVYLENKPETKFKKLC